MLMPVSLRPTADIEPPGAMSEAPVRLGIRPSIFDFGEYLARSRRYPPKSVAFCDATTPSPIGSRHGRHHRNTHRSPRLGIRCDRGAEPRGLAPAHGSIRGDPERDHDERGDPVPHPRSGHHRRRRPVADDRVHADDGRRHPDHRVPPAALHHSAGVHRGDDPVLGRDARGLRRARVRGARHRPRGPGLGHGHHDAAAHDHDHDHRAAAPARADDGTRQHRDGARARDRADDVGPGAAVARLALDLRHRAPHRARRPVRRRPVDPQPGRDPQGPDRRPVRHPLRLRVRRPRVRPEPDRRRRTRRRSRCRCGAVRLDRDPHRLARRRRGRPRPLRPGIYKKRFRCRCCN